MGRGCMHGDAFEKICSLECDLNLFNSQAWESLCTALNETK